ncbi:peptidylprolyl isomerase [Flavobacteriales bacterium]|jgi:peptidyl-prolyl cis-trans isomerase D|nr:peptidylprolyl isomerase [Flavobacteriales bacterium]
MSMIQQIRNRQGLLIVMIGIGMLGFLVPYDAVMALMGQGTNRDVGEVDGIAITALEYQSELQERRRLGFSGDQLGDEVWNDLTSNIVLGDDFDALGLQVCDEEFQEMLFGSGYSPYMNRAFYSNAENKQFWQQNFGAMLATPQGKSDFMSYKRLIVSKRLREKFDNLVSSGVYTNALEGKYDFVTANNKVNFNYAFKSFNDIDDSEVSVSDADVKSYYRAHKGDDAYEQNTGRTITFARIPLAASAEDAEAIESDLSELKGLWSSSALSDSEFVATANEKAFAATVLKSADVETDLNESTLFNANPGDFVGPYLKKQSYKLARVMEFFSEPDSASCRHILLKAGNPQDAAEMDGLVARADSLKRALRRGASFEDLAERFSEDPGSKTNGGFYDFFTRGRMVKPFEDFCFESKPGSIGAVRTQFGVHLIEVMEHTDAIERVRVAMIERVIVPSAETARNSYSAASEFAIASNSREAFMTASSEAGYATSTADKVLRKATSISGLRNATELVSWAYNAEQGAVSNPILIDKNYVVAHLDMITAQGEPEFSAVEQEMRTAAVKEAKGKLYASKMNAGSLDEIAAAIGSSVKAASNISLKFPTVSAAGAKPEPEVVGRAFAIANGEVSMPIVGENGVWVIAPTSSTEAAEKKDFLSEQTSLLARARGAVTQRISNAMLDAAELTDNRN